MAYSQKKKLSHAVAHVLLFIQVCLCDYAGHGQNIQLACHLYQRIHIIPSACVCVCVLCFKVKHHFLLRCIFKTIHHIFVPLAYSAMPRIPTCTIHTRLYTSVRSPFTLNTMTHFHSIHFIFAHMCCCIYFCFVLFSVCCCVCLIIHTKSFVVLKMYIWCIGIERFLDCTIPQIYTRANGGKATALKYHTCVSSMFCLQYT